MAFIFDYNGTMVFDSPFHDKAWKIFSKQIRGYEMSEEEIINNVHGLVNEKIIQYLKPHISEKENKCLSLEKEKMYREMCTLYKDDYQLVDGLENFLNDLKKNHQQINIASASIKENIDFFVETFQLNRWFEENKIIYDNGKYDNKIEMFKDAARNMNVDISDCIIFEDSISGLSFAREAGAKLVIAIADKEKEKELKHNPNVDFIIEDFNDERLKGLQ